MLKPTLIPATLADYPTIQNMGRFYVYDMSRYCGFISDEWNLPTDGLYECIDFKSYFEDLTREPYLVKVGDELAGFVLLDREGTSPETQWNMGEFFILAKFQGKGIGADVARHIWRQHPGLWEVSVIPENKKPHQFWSQTISDFTNGNFTEEVKIVHYDSAQPHRIIFSFEIQNAIMRL